MSRPHVSPRRLAKRMASRNLRRLADLRAVIQPFAPVNPYQGQLRALLLTMMDFMEGAYCRPPRPRRPEDAAEFERWWGIAKRYARTLLSPEMARKGAFRVLTKLLG